ncbi:MAG TPA: thioesterase family protein [Kofleriaceae bacterium]|nr:thioesterase family protein [Kofleriaceae bacterium]
MSFADLAADTSVRADADVPGRYHLTLPDHWDYLLPSGGVVMTAALRAADAHLADPTLRLASATTIFASSIHPGKCLADVHVIRRGGNTAQVRVILRHTQEKDAQPGLELVATFIRRDRKGPDVIGVAFPEVKSLADAVSVDDGASNNPHTRFRFYHQLECKLADGAAFWQPDFAAGPATYARWFRYRHPQLDAEGFLDRLAIPPLVDTMPTALHRAIGPGGYRFYAPSLDLTVYTIDDTRREWLLVAVTMRRARGGWAIADAEVWDDEGRFLAYGSQAMYLHGVSGDPPTIDASRRP